ncbi:MAG: 6,7-dimethyl-8-ribityllumazine synthase [Lentisphaerae bacterium]|nr:6,7-dimethyl-8-ribityllumazine synthase [Lentisphaerota bacterium]
MKEISATLDATGMRFGIVVSRFNSLLTKQLLDGAVDCLVRHGAAPDAITAAWVPGGNETPMAARKMAAGGAYDAVIVLGAVIQGATPHADLINNQVARALSQLAAEGPVPVINGMVAAQTLEQAIERSGTKAGNKGWNAAQAAVEMVALYRALG